MWSYLPVFSQGTTAWPTLAKASRNAIQDIAAENAITDIVVHIIILVLKKITKKSAPTMLIASTVLDMSIIVTHRYPWWLVLWASSSFYSSSSAAVSAPAVACTRCAANHAL